MSHMLNWAESLTPMVAVLLDRIAPKVAAIFFKGKAMSLSEVKSEVGQLFSF